MRYAFLLYLFLPAALLPGQSFRTHSVSVFKNGVAFFDKSTTVDASEGAVLFSDLPFAGEAMKRTVPPSDAELPVLFGALYFHTPGNRLQSVKTWRQEETTEQPPADLGRLLEGNAGKEVRVWLRDRAEPLTGYVERTIGGGPARLFLRTGQNWHLLSLEEVTDLEFLEEPRLFQTVTRGRPVLELAFDEPRVQQEVRLWYLQRGITWTPQYLLELTGGQTARLTLQASLVNDLEDLTAVDVNFVVGVPAFRFGFAADPLLSSRSVAQLLRQLQNPPREEELFLANTITSQRMQRQPAESSFPATDAGQAEGAGEDLFFYRREKVTLPKGGRMQVSLLETDLRYEDLYTVELQGNRADYGYYREAEERENRVWHELKFRNESGSPLTTGSVFFLQRGEPGPRPVSQNQLDFTPAGATAQVRMSVAPDIGVRDRELETDRRRDARDDDDLVTVEATVEIANFKDRPVRLQLTRDITGEPLESDLDWTTEALARNLNALNKEFRLQWEASLEAGEKRTLTYRYQVYLE